MSDFALAYSNARRQLLERDEIISSLRREIGELKNCRQLAYDHEVAASVLGEEIQRLHDEIDRLNAELAQLYAELEQRGQAGDYTMTQGLLR